MCWRSMWDARGVRLVRYARGAPLVCERVRVFAKTGVCNPKEHGETHFGCSSRGTAPPEARRSADSVVGTKQTIFDAKTSPCFFVVRESSRLPSARGQSPRARAGRLAGTDAHGPPAHGHERRRRRAHRRGACAQLPSAEARQWGKRGSPGRPEPRARPGRRQGRLARGRGRSQQGGSGLWSARGEHEGGQTGDSVRRAFVCARGPLYSPTPTEHDAVTPAWWLSVRPGGSPAILTPRGRGASCTAEQHSGRYRETTG